MSRRAQRWLLASLFFFALWLTPHTFGQAAPFQSPPAENRLYIPQIGSSGVNAPARAPALRSRNVPPVLILAFFFVLILATVITARRRR